MTRFNPKTLLPFVFVVFTANASFAQSNSLEPVLDMMPVATEKPASEQTLSEFVGAPVETKALNLGKGQAIWNDVCDNKVQTDENLNDQTSKGIQIYHYNQFKVMPLCARVGAATVIRFPEWETIEPQSVPGETVTFSATLRDDRTFFVRPKHYGPDTTLHLFGTSGNIYTFILKAISSDHESPADVTIFIDAPAPLSASQNLANGSVISSKTVAMTQDINPKATSKFNPLLDKPKLDYLRTLEFNIENLECDDFEVLAQNKGGEEIKPVQVCHDGVFTMIDFGKKADVMRRPNVFEVIDGFDAQVNVRTKGSRGQFLIVETVGDFILMHNTAVVCVNWLGRERVLVDQNKRGI